MRSVHEILTSLAIPYVEHKHPAVYTCEEADKFYEGLEGGKTKNLLLRNKNADHFYLVITESSQKLDFKHLAAILEESKLSFASPEKMMELLGLTPGSVSPFGLINDTGRQVTVVVHRNLYRYDKLHFHPNDNTATLALATNDFKKFLDSCGNRIVSFG